MEKPKAEGLKWRPRKKGPDVPYWVATAAAVKQGYRPATVRLTGFADEREMIGRCQRLQAEMLQWLTGRTMTKAKFDGTFASVIAHWQVDPDSPYHKLKPSSKHPYDIYAKRLTGHIGARRIDASDVRSITQWFKIWSEDGKKIPAGRMAVCVLKAAVTFGKGCRLRGCAELQSILRDMEFPTNRRREFAPVAAEIVAVRKAAHAAGQARRALAYAIQFETTLRQWDVTGQWLPLSDKRPSSVLGYGEKWIGPTWANIDADLLLRLTPGKTEDTSEARVTFDLKECPMVLEELNLIPLEARTGPLVISERTGLPYRYDAFKDGWKADFKAAGIKAGTWNRDFRAGGNTEGQRSGARLEDRRKVTGHADERITAEVYDRDVLEAHRRVAKARVKSRTNEA